MANNTSYGSSGFYSDTISTQSGCDSVRVLDLTINNSTTAIDTQIACDSYRWIDGVVYTSSTSTPTFTIAGGNQNGCDSTVTLNLTINNSTFDTTTQVACGSYTWPVNNTTYTSSGFRSVSLTNQFGCDSILVLALTINQAGFTANAGADQLICDQNTATLQAADPAPAIGRWEKAGANSSIISNPNNATTTITNLEAGIYTYRWILNNGVCPPDTDNVVITVSEKPMVNVGSDQSIFQVDGIQLNATVTPMEKTTYQWGPVSFIEGSANIINPFARPTISTEFLLIATDSLGCTGRDSLFVEVKDGLIIPTAFTPNNDGFNDTWEIKNLELFSPYTVAVYNGYGTPLFTTANYSPWDGKFEGEDLPTGSYYYMIELSTGGTGKRIETGLISIIR
jgi:gliding motility-associated-like protein